jgi:hypothetical protein
MKHDKINYTIHIFIPPFLNMTMIPAVVFFFTCIRNIARENEFAHIMTAFPLDPLITRQLVLITTAFAVAAARNLSHII